MTQTAAAYQPKPLPTPEAHHPLTVRNRTGKGTRNGTGCSCGWRASSGVTRMSTMWNAWKQHLRREGIAHWTHDPGHPVQGEGTFAGWTWEEYHAAMTEAGFTWDDERRPDYFTDGVEA